MVRFSTQNPNLILTMVTNYDFEVTKSSHGDCRPMVSFIFCVYTAAVWLRYFLYFYVILHSNVFCTQLSGCPYLTKVSKRSLLSKAQLLRPDYEAAASGLKLREAELGGRCRRVLARRRRAVVLRLV